MSGKPTTVDLEIEAAIAKASAIGYAANAAPGRGPHESLTVIKYTGAKYGGRYPPGPNSKGAVGLYVSPSPGFTWGPGVYACPIAYPISGAIYGRCGIVAQIPSTHGWKIFDATDQAIANLYVAWAQQQPLYPMLTLTAHANWANHLLRTLFKERFAIDVVIFRPDEFHNRYTNRVGDRWLAISEWSAPGKLASGVIATRVVQAQLTVILAEEFEPTLSGIRRNALIGPTPTLATMLPTPADILNAYSSQQLLWVGA